MGEITSYLGMTAFQFIMNCVLCTVLLGALITYVISRYHTPKDKPERHNHVEIRSEISRRKQEDDELTAIMNESNSDDLYTD